MKKWFKIVLLVLFVLIIVPIIFVVIFEYTNSVVLCFDRCLSPAYKARQNINHPSLTATSTAIQTTPISSTLVFEGKTLTLVTPTDKTYAYSNIFYYKDSQNVYIVYYRHQPVIIVGANPGSFTLDFPNNYYFDFAKDNHAIYFRGKNIFNLKNPQTNFSILGWAGQDCKGASYVMVTNTDGTKSIYSPDFHNNDGNTSFDLVQGADPETFITLTTGYAKDKNYVYLGTERTLYDPKTFDLEKAMSLCPLG